MPEEIGVIATYIRSVKFESTPDYGYIKDLLETVATAANFALDYNYDWFAINELNLPVHRK